jgi:hypothetical protein
LWIIYSEYQVSAIGVGHSDNGLQRFLNNRATGAETFEFNSARLRRYCENYIDKVIVHIALIGNTQDGKVLVPAITDQHTSCSILSLFPPKDIFGVRLRKLGFTASLKH